MQIKVPTRINLDNQGIDLNSVRCPVCDDDLETEDHILVLCCVAKNTRCEVLKWWKIEDISLDSINDVFTLASCSNLAPKLSKVLVDVVQSTLWILWRFRNNDSIFASTRPNRSLILNDFKLYSFNWISNRLRKAWLSNPFNTLSNPL